MPQGEGGVSAGGLPGCGPLILPDQGPERSLKDQVFDRIRAAGEIARVDLARDLAISPASITTISADLIERRLVAEVATPKASDSSRGRPPVALTVRPDAGFVAGIKLSDHIHTAVLLDFAGHRIAAASIPSRVAIQGADEIELAAANVLQAVLRQGGLQPHDLKALGVGLPGTIDAGHGRVLWSPLIRERGLDLAARLARRLDCPVYIDNDANMVTLAELWFGAGRRLADFAVVTIEHGVGMGLVVNHRLYRGAGGMGMELGHTKVQLDGALCRCGQRGCLEAYVADYALVREAATALGVAVPSASDSTHGLLEDLFLQAKAGNAAARMIFDRASRYLAVGLANIVNLFDPSLIILSGERMRYDFLYANEMLSEMSRLTLNVGREPPRVEINAWGDMVWAQGAAALALTHASETALAV
jgi:predicted NBD/HSP70 family sugar kinase